MTTSGLPTVTLTSAPGLVTSTVLVPGSYETVAPICSNIERSGMRMVPPRTSAARTRPCFRSSGLAYTWWSLKRIGICPDGGEPKFAGGTAGAAGAGAAGAGDAMGVAAGAADPAGAGDPAGMVDAAGAGDAGALAAGDGAAVACAIALSPMLPCDALSGAATALSPRPAVISTARTPVLSRFKSYPPS